MSDYQHPGAPSHGAPTPTPAPASTPPPADQWQGVPGALTAALAEQNPQPDYLVLSGGARRYRVLDVIPAGYSLRIMELQASGKLADPNDPTAIQRLQRDPEFVRQQFEMIQLMIDGLLPDEELARLRGDMMAKEHPIGLAELITSVQQFMDGDRLQGGLGKEQ